MPIDALNDLEYNKFVESTDTPGTKGIVALNPDGSTISGGSGSAAYSNSSNVDKKGLVDADRHVQVDVLTMPEVSATVDTTGLATSAKQDTIIGHVDGIETILGTMDTDTGGIATSTASIDTKTPALGQALAAASVPVVLPAAQITTLTPPAAITGFATSAKQDTIIGHVDGLEALATTIDADTSNISTKIDTVAGAVATEGSALGSGVLLQGDDGTDRTNVLVDTSGHLQVDVLTLPAGGSGLTDAELRATPVPVDLGANNDVTVTGTVDLGATDNAVLDSIDADLTTVIGHVDGIETLLGTTNTTLTTIDGRVDGLETLVTSTNTKLDTTIGHVDGIETVLGTIDADTGNISTKIDTIAGDTTSIQTAVELLDDTVATLGTDTYTEASTKGGVIGAVRRDADTTLVNTTNEIAPLQVDARGLLKVEAFSGETLPVSLTSTTVTGTVAVTQSGTWDEVGINDSGNSITVDYATTGSGTATGALRVELPTNGTGVIATVGAVTAITNALPAGTNAIGKLSANSGVDIGDVDVTSIPALVAGTAEIGSLLPPDTDVTAHTNYARKYYTNAGAVTDGIIWSPATGKRWHVVTMYIQTSADATITLEDDKAGGDDPVWKGEISAKSGLTLSFTEQYPMASGEDASDLIVTTTAGNIYITCVGYEI